MPSAFEPRAPRYELDIPVEFLGDGEIFVGRCINISQSGVLARFERPLELWTTGELRLHAGRRSCKVTARVARSHEHETGLVFRFNENAGDPSLSLVRALIEEARQQGEGFTPPF